MKKILFIIIVLVIVSAVWQMLGGSDDIADSGTEKFKEEVLALSDDHEDVLLTIDNPVGDTAISFAVIEQGNKNVFGNIVKSNLGSGEHKIIDEFGTSPFRFEDTVSFVDNYRIKFTETAVFGGGDSFSAEKIINLKNDGKNIDLPNIEDDADDYFKRHNITNAVSVNEFRTAYEWVDNNTVEFERSFSDSIGHKYPVETWQYNIKTGEYTLISSE